MDIKLPEGITIEYKAAEKDCPNHSGKPILLLKILTEEL